MVGREGVPDDVPVAGRLAAVVARPDPDLRLRAAGEQANFVRKSTRTKERIRRPSRSRSCSGDRRRRDLKRGSEEGGGYGRRAEGVGERVDGGYGLAEEDQATW